MPKIVSEQEREIMRRQIIGAAAEEFSRVGFEQTGIEAVAERAKVGKGTIYLYFDSKKGLFLAMLEEIARQQLAELKAALAKQSGLKAKVATLVASFNQQIQEQPEAFRIFISSLFGVNRQFKQEAAIHRRNFLKLIEDLLEEARAAGEITLPVEPAALFLLNTCESLALHAEALGFDPGYISSQETLIFEMLMAGLKVERHRL